MRTEPAVGGKLAKSVSLFSLIPMANYRVGQISRKGIHMASGRSTDDSRVPFQGVTTIVVGDGSWDRVRVGECVGVVVAPAFHNWTSDFGSRWSRNWLSWYNLA
jgi:hypothetical protein